MLNAVLALVSACHGWAHDHDIRALGLDDAISRIYVQAGRIVPVGDLDRDGAPGIAMATVDGNDFAIQVWSARDGKLVRTLWKGWVPGVSSSDLVWDAGGDVDADGVPDVVVGLPRDAAAEGGSGAVVVVSGANGALVQRLVAPAGGQSFGCSAAFAGDLDGDGLDDIVVGSRNLPPEMDQGNGELQRGLLLLPEATVDQSTLLPGRVAAYSGRSGNELWSVQRGLPGEGFGSRIQVVGDLDVDGTSDLIAESDPGPGGYRASLLSGATGSEIASISGLGRARAAGDFDGDNVPDLCFGAADVSKRGTQVISGATQEAIFRCALLDPFSGEADRAQAVGDLDGDGVDDLAIGAPSFRFPARQAHFHGDSTASSSLSEVLRLSAVAGSSNFESGCLVVYSGRTRAPIWGCFGRPNQNDCLGLAAAAIPDVSGDGYSDLVVAGVDKTYVFPGPGKSAD
jgi:hypothetical protein